jgi:phage shock protein A
VIENIKKYFKSKKQLINDVGHLHHQIQLMQTHIQSQNDEKMKLNIRVNELERQIEITKNLLDISSNTKRY